MIRGANFGTYVILTGLLVETLGGLSEMVIIETSSQEFLIRGTFSNKISLLSIKCWTPIFNNKHLLGRYMHKWQLSSQPGNRPTCNRFCLIVKRGVVKSFTEETKKSSSTSMTPWPCLGIGAVMTLGVSGGLNSTSFASIRSCILFFNVQQMLVSCPGL